jgi:DNA-binding transcriptional MocR family regulator
MSIKLMAMAFDARVSNPLRKLILLKLCDHANEKGQCWPSLSYIADQCEISRRSVITHIQALISDGYLSSEPRFKDGEQTTNMYTVSQRMLIKSMPDGGAGDALGGETHAPPLVQELHPPSAGAAPRTTIEPPLETNKRSRVKKSEKTFTEWAEETREKGESLISDTDPIITHTESMGVPFDFLMVAWCAFKDQYTNDNLKKQKDWRAYFRNAIKGDWLRVWAFNQAGECYLTTKGKQYLNIMERSQ